MKSELGYWSDMKTTLPPCLSQFDTMTLAMRGFPDPPGPVIRVDVPVGQPWGRSFRSHGSAILRVNIFFHSCFSLGVLSLPRAASTRQWRCLPGG